MVAVASTPSPAPHRQLLSLRVVLNSSRGEAPSVITRSVAIRLSARHKRGNIAQKRGDGDPRAEHCLVRTGHARARGAFAAPAGAETLRVSDMRGLLMATCRLEIPNHE